MTKPGKGQATATSAIGRGEGVKSTAWNPLRYADSTEAGKQRLTNEQHNTAVLAAIHQQNPAARGVEAITMLGGPYLIKPGDVPSVVKQKIEAFNRDFGGGAAAPIEDQPPPGFEEQ